MKYFKKSYFLLVLVFVLSSCLKELSLENNGKPVATQNCKIQKLIQADPNTGNSEYAYISTYDSSNLTLNIQLIDSSVNTIDAYFPISYSTGKVQVDADQFFLVGSDGRVTQFHGYEYPEDNTSQMLTAKYTYNSAGQLVKRTEEYDTLPGVVTFQMDYIYSSNNLIRADISYNLGAAFAKIAEVTYEYDASKTIKNFLFLHALGRELSYFQTAVNAGTNSTNPVNKATVEVLDPNTGGTNTFVTNFVNYSINSNNYVESFELTGDDFDVAGLNSGKRYILDYSCL